MDFWSEPLHAGEWFLKTAFLLDWNRTVLNALTSEPLEFSNNFSRTQAQAHHDRGVTYLFDLWVEPSVSQASLDELKEMNVRLVIFGESGGCDFVGLDGIFRIRFSLDSLRLVL